MKIWKIHIKLRRLTQNVFPITYVIFAFNGVFMILYLRKILLH